MKNTRYQKPFIYYEDLKGWEITLMVIYAIATLLVIMIGFSGSKDIKQALIMGYWFATQFGLYLGLYTSLRNFRSYLVWFCFGIVHLILFFIFRSDPALIMPRGNAANGLPHTIVLLLLFQALRYLSLKIQNREFVAPSHGGKEDLFENKKITGADYFLFIIYMAAFGGLFYLSTLY